MCEPKEFFTILLPYFMQINIFTFSSKMYCGGHFIAAAAAEHALS